MKTIVTTELIRAIAEKYGVKVYNVLTGFKFIADIVRRNEGKGEFICGGEESYGFNIGQFVRDKDAPISCAMVAECAAWAADQGKTLYQLLQDIYAEFGYYKEGLVSLVRKGKSGVEEIAAIMSWTTTSLRRQDCQSPMSFSSSRQRVMWFPSARQALSLRLNSISAQEAHRLIPR